MPGLLIRRAEVRVWRADCFAEGAVLGCCRGRGAEGLSRCRDGAGGASSPRTGGAAPAADQGLRAACAPRADAGGGSTLVDGQLSCECEFCSANTYMTCRLFAAHSPSSTAQRRAVVQSLVQHHAADVAHLRAVRRARHAAVEAAVAAATLAGPVAAATAMHQLLKKVTANRYRVRAHCGFGCLSVDHG